MMIPHFIWMDGEGRYLDFPCQAAKCLRLSAVMQKLGVLLPPVFPSCLLTTTEPGSPSSRHLRSHCCWGFPVQLPPPGCWPLEMGSGSPTCPSEPALGSWDFASTSLWPRQSAAWSLPPTRGPPDPICLLSWLDTCQRTLSTSCSGSCRSRHDHAAAPIQKAPLYQ